MHFWEASGSSNDCYEICKMCDLVTLPDINPYKWIFGIPLFFRVRFLLISGRGNPPWPMLGCSPGQTSEGCRWDTPDFETKTTPTFRRRIRSRRCFFPKAEAKTRNEGAKGWSLFEDFFFGFYFLEIHKIKSFLEDKGEMYQSTPRVEECFSFCVWIYYINVSCRLVRWILEWEVFEVVFCVRNLFLMRLMREMLGMNSSGMHKKGGNPSFRVGRVWLKTIWLLLSRQHLNHFVFVFLQLSA